MSPTIRRGPAPVTPPQQSQCARSTPVDPIDMDKDDGTGDDADELASLILMGSFFSHNTCCYS